MVKTVTSQAERTRPTSRLQSQNLLETTPVLFRLPTVEFHPFQSVAAQENESQPTAQELAPPLMRSVAPKQGLAEPVRGSTSSNLTSEFDSSSAIESIGSSDGVRSWWEHWSSGVVMIVLIIAMLVLGLLAVRSNKQPSNAIATTELESEFGDLESITVPTPQITETILESAAIPAATSAEDQPVVSTDSALATDLANVEVAPFETAASGSSDSSPPTASQAALPTIGQIPATQSGQDQLATATLLPPTPHEAPQQQYSQAASVPSIGELNQLSNSAQSASAVPAFPAANQLGQSPSLYDEATRKLQSELSESIAANPGFSMPNLAGDSPAIAPVTTQVSAPLVSATSSPQTPVLRSTATPDSNEEEIIRAYLELSQSTQPPPTSPSTNNPNRYHR